jgi:glycosyltransferase involved in cell wall biosynthesis
VVRDDGTGTLIGPPDLFRIAHTHFSLHGQLLPVIAEGPGIMHWTYPLPLYVEGWANLYTVHDAIPLTQPDLTPIDAVRHRRLLERIVNRADRIVTVSCMARDEIVTALGCDPTLVVNCGQAVSCANPAPVLPPGLSPGGYYLFCGTIEPRKNLLSLAEAHLQSRPTRPLVICGPLGWRGRDIQRRLERMPNVRLMPYLDRAMLLGLIASARALLFPSLAEGFGLPVAEAMTLGTPVLTSAGGALEEVAGGAAQLVDPRDTGEMARRIVELDSSDRLCQELAERGLVRAEAFALDRFAARIGALHRCVAPRTRALAGAA